MARRRRCPHRRQSMARRGGARIAQARELGAIIGSAVRRRRILSGDSRSSAILGLADSGTPEASSDSTNERTPEVIEESSTQPAVEDDARLIRVRASNNRRVLYSAEDPTGVVAAQSSLTPIHFGGVYRGYDSNIIVLPDDLVYFDKTADFIKLGVINLQSTPVDASSEMQWIALNIGQLHPTPLDLIVCTIENPALAGLFLVVEDDSVGDIVRHVQPNKWGFKEVPKESLREYAPRLYEQGLKLVDRFNSFLDEGKMEYAFVFDWGRLGEE
ncbi:hypothetical protein F4803DRAFT_536577 [Xylaria telfairii]|nr:hypothetical protein F4803DRAFT_536577 [Xylaria telfairii]